MLARWIAFGSLFVASPAFSLGEVVWEPPQHHELLLPPDDFAFVPAGIPTSNADKLLGKIVIDDRFVYFTVINPSSEPIGYTRGQGPDTPSPRGGCIRVRKDGLVIPSWGEQGSCFSANFFVSTAYSEPPIYYPISPSEELFESWPLSKFFFGVSELCGAACEVQVEINVCAARGDCRTFTSDWTFVTNVDVNPQLDK